MFSLGMRKIFLIQGSVTYPGLQMVGWGRSGESALTMKLKGQAKNTLCNLVLSTEIKF